MKTLCYSVRLKSLERLSDKAYRATAFDGSTDIIPVSQVYARDYETQKSDAWWISAWILDKKDIQYSTKKKAWFDEHRNRMNDFQVVRHTPEKMDAVQQNIIIELKK